MRKDWTGKKKVACVEEKGKTGENKKKKGNLKKRSP